MRRVIALELVGLKKLDCDLYDEEGKIIYNKGTEFTPEIFMMLTHSKVFKRDEEQLTREETVPEWPKLSIGENFEVSEPLSTEETSEFKSVFNEQRKDTLVNGVRQLLQGVIDQTPIKLQTCIDATEIILEEVYEKFDKVNNFGELRVYDYYTFSHSINVAILSTIIGTELGYNESKLKDLTFSAFLHDIGKLQVPKEILYKPQGLSPEEMNLVKQHTQFGSDFITNKLKLPDTVAKAALSHHERWEGQGYPHGLKGNAISEFAQVIAIADVYDALISEKVYRGPVQSIEAIRVLLTEEAKSFNPKILNKFVYLAVIKSETGANSLI